VVADGSAALCVVLEALQQRAARGADASHRAHAAAAHAALLERERRGLLGRREEKCVEAEGVSQAAPFRAQPGRRAQSLEVHAERRRFGLTRSCTPSPKCSAVDATTAAGFVQPKNEPDWLARLERSSVRQRRPRTRQRQWRRRRRRRRQRRQRG
jgi:hypothetical protein